MIYVCIIQMYNLYLHKTAIQKRKRDMIFKQPCEEGEQEASDNLIEGNINNNQVCIKQHVICYQPGSTM